MPLLGIISELAQAGVGGGVSPSTRFREELTTAGVGAGARRSSHITVLKASRRGHPSKTKKKHASVAAVAASAHCDFVAAPNGNDSAAGTAAAPFQTVQQLYNALQPGQTGCLRTGKYGNADATYNFDKSGAPGRPITLTAFPGEKPLVHGFIGVSGAYNTISHLTIDGDNTVFNAKRAEEIGCYSYGHPVSAGMTVDGSHFVFEHNDLYQSVPKRRGVAIGLGWNSSSDPIEGVIIRNNKIHDVGGCKAFDHHIYVAHTQGAQIYQNWMWNNPHGWAVQLYPSAQNTLVHSNVIDKTGAGVIMGSDTYLGAGAPSSGNHVFNNVVMRSTGLPNAGTRGAVVTAYWPEGKVGSGNRVYGNLSWENRDGVASQHYPGISVSGNITTDPHLANPNAHDYRTTASSPAAIKKWHLWNGS